MEAIKNILEREQVRKFKGRYVYPFTIREDVVIPLDRKPGQVITVTIPRQAST